MPSHVSQRVSPELTADAASSRRSAAPPARVIAPRDPASLHISKLRGISIEARGKLKRQGITYTDQLLQRAGTTATRQRIAASTGIAEPELLRLARRADLARIKGVGAIFADMLELIGVYDVGALAARDPAALHARLHALNAAERFARRAPTPEEVADWVHQARRAPRLLDPEAH